MKLDEFNAEFVRRSRWPDKVFRIRRPVPGRLKVEGFWSATKRELTIQRSDVYADDWEPWVSSEDDRLREAAPDLLAALEGLLEQADLGEIHDDETREAVDSARRAIAKARGEG